MTVSQERPMTPKILQAAALPPSLEAALAQLGAIVHPLHAEPDPAAFLARRGADFTVLVTNATVGADARRMAQLPGLKAICSLGVGCDAIDLVSARERGIAVSNTPDVLSGCVADLAMGLLIDVARGMSAADRRVRRGDWARQGPPAPAARVHGKRLGLLGMGAIAEAIARRASGFSMDIRYHCRSPRPALAWRHEPSLLDLAEWADFLVVACSGGPETHHLVSARVLRALGPQAFLVNVARGSIVDEAALVEALRTGELAGAALDVFADEPQVPPQLAELDSVVLLPHIGSATRETRQAMAQLVVRNVESFLESGRLVTAVA